MNQARIMALLIEASTETCSEHRRENIGDTLMAAIITDNQSSHDTEGSFLLAQSVYIETLQNAPHMLPYQYPLFAAACGDREPGMPMAIIDYTHMRMIKELS